MLEQQIHNREDRRRVFKHIFYPHDALLNSGMHILCADGLLRQYDPVICASTADYFKNIQLQSIKQSHCPVFEAPNSLLTEGNSLSWQLKDYQLYF